MRILTLCLFSTIPAVFAAWEAPKFLDDRGQWQSRGCWKDDQGWPNSAGLNDGSYTSTNGMDLELCRDLAQKDNRKFFAVSNRDQCHWGQRISPTASYVGDKDCVERCPSGPANRQCGGKNRMTIYENLFMPASPGAPEWLDNGWHFIGCRYDYGATFSQGLNGGGFTFYGGMTLDFCRQQAGGAKYFAVADKDFCYYGDFLASTSSQQGMDRCDTRCTPNQYQSCGGLQNAVVYENTNYVAPAVAPQNIGKCGTYGCWSDSTSDRTLKEGHYNNYGGMTLNECLNAAGNARFAGVEYGGECYWSSIWDSQSQPKPFGECNMRCPGDAGQLCGGGGRLQLYINQQWIQPKASDYGDWTHQGCLADDGNKRILRDGSVSDYGGMTVERCAAAAAGHQYFGLEYSGECYWGNDILPINGGQQFNDGSCNKGCSGNQAQLCGGANRINLYRNFKYVVPPRPNPGLNGFKHQGCYTDDPNSRALANLYEDWGAMRVQRCILKAAGFKYAAVEYYGQCWYGNELNSQYAGNQADCNTGCKGSPGETCGGANRINLYLNEAYVPPAITTQGPINGFTYVGCYTDNGDSRTLENLVEDFNGMTVAACVAPAAGYKYAAVEYYGQCFFGNEIRNGAQAAGAEGCNTPCNGNKNELCGGSGRLGLYQNQNYVPGTTSATKQTITASTAVSTRITSTSTTLTVVITSTTTSVSASPTVNPGVSAFVSRGCYIDSGTARALSQAAEPDWTGNTVAKCIAKAAGYRYAGVEYYGECYYGNTLASSQAPIADCNTPCSGNVDELCGGGNRLNIYENTAFAQPSSSMATSPAVPTANPGLGAFALRGCYTDSTNTRALEGGSSTDYAGMTVAKCIDLAGSFQYAAVEYYGECYWGNTLSSNPATEGCTTYCAGNNAELCGGGDRITLYQNSDWVNPNPTVAELIALVEKLVGMLAEFAEAVVEWQNAVIAYQNLAGGKRTRRGPLEDAAIVVKSGYEKADRLGSRLCKRSPDSIPDLPRFFLYSNVFGDLLTGSRVDLRIGEPSKPGPDVETINNAYEMNTINDPIRQQADAISSQANNLILRLHSPRAGSPDSAASVVSDVTTIIGTVAEVEAVTAAGPGGLVSGVQIFGFSLRRLFAMINLYLVTILPRISIPVTPTPTTTTKTCSATSAPTSIVIITSRESKRSQFDKLVEDIKAGGGEIKRQIIYDDVNFRALVAGVDNCVEDLVANDPIVRSISLNAQGTLDGAGVSGPMKREKPPVSHNETSFHMLVEENEDKLSTRTYEGGTFTMQGDSPNHLRWLSSPWAKNASTGNYHNFEDYLYDTSEDVRVRIYVMDTGARSDHWEFAEPVPGAIGPSRIARSFDAVDNRNVQDGIMIDEDESSGHGTCMMSCAGGRVSGVYKTAELVPVRICKAGEAVNLDIIVDSVGWILDATRKDNKAGKAVLSMSIGFPPGLFRTPRIGMIYDPFPELLLNLYAAGIAVFASAGNYADRGQDLRAETPRMWGGRDKQLTVVGATNFYGQRWDKSAFLERDGRGVLSIYANGIDVLCAHPQKMSLTDGRVYYKSQSGTSPATATIAGLAAYYLSKNQYRTQLLSGGVGQVSMNVKKFLQELGGQKKGTFWDGIPRAANDVEIQCEATNPPAVQAAVYDSEERVFYLDIVYDGNGQPTGDSRDRYPLPLVMAPSTLGKVSQAVPEMFEAPRVFERVFADNKSMSSRAA